MNAADDHWMSVALAEAEAAAARGEVPVGAVLVGPNPGELLASAGAFDEVRFSASQELVLPVGLDEFDGDRLLGRLGWHGDKEGGEESGDHGVSRNVSDRLRQKFEKWKGFLEKIVGKRLRRLVKLWDF